MNDFAAAFLFWLLYELLSLPLRWALVPFALPVEVRRLLSRVAGPALLALLAGGLAHGPVPLGRSSGWAIALLAGAGGLSFAAASRGPSGLREALRESCPIADARWRRDLVLELTLLAIFFGYVAFRRLAPEMTFEVQNSGAEKFPNAMLFWSCWHATTLPPEDYWFAGLPQAYYYAGHGFWAWIGRLGPFAPASVIALALARVVTLVTEASMLLLRALGLRWWSALGGAVAIAWGGNPDAWITLRQQAEFHSRGGALIRGDSLGAVIRNLGDLVRDWNWAGYSFWEPSRVIPDTVNEFPAWSAILGDFHAHHLALPWLIGWFALLARADAWFLRRRDALPARVPDSILGVILFAALGTIAVLANVWSLPVVLAALPVVGLWRARGIRFPFAASCVVALLLATLAGMALGGQHPLAPLAAAEGGAGFAARIPLRPLDPAIRSTAAELLRLWGFQVAALLAAVSACAIRARGRRARLGLAVGMALIALQLLVLNGITVQRNEPALLGLGLACAVIAAAQGPRPWFPARVAAAGAGAGLLLAGLELLYIPDRMTGELARYNTYFKLSYAAWPLLSAVAWIGAVRLWNLPRRGLPRTALRLALLPMIPALAGLLVFGVPARVLQARFGDAAPRRPTLDAFAWLANRPGYEAEAEALAWIRAHVPVGQVVASAAPPAAYAYQGRVASLAGRPVPLGWAHHEAQWRGAAVYDALAERHDAVNALFLAADAQSLRRAAAALSARWVLMGRNERETYGADAFDRTLDLLHAAGSRRAAFPETAPEVFVFELPAP